MPTILIMTVFLLSNFTIILYLCESNNTQRTARWLLPHAPSATITDKCHKKKHFRWWHVFEDIM